jgi:hypothetical protein
MIENANASKQPSNGEFIDIKKYIGVASLNVVAINPNNEKLRMYGWNIPEGADEPVYIKTFEKDGKQQQMTRIRFLVQIQDLEDKPVTYLDFICKPEFSQNNPEPNSGKLKKWKIIDSYGRTAWATKEEIEGHKIPQYTNGPANISTPYKICHPGEEELISFLYKYLNITPLQIFDRTKQTWVTTTNPGRLTIDDWKSICDGNTKELAYYVSQFPQNCVKVVLGVQTTDDNKTYQTFLNTGYIGNGSRPNMGTGEYDAARKLIDKYYSTRDQSQYSFSAAPVREWTVTASKVEDNSLEPQPDDLPFFGGSDTPQW